MVININQEWMTLDGVYLSPGHVRQFDRVADIEKQSAENTADCFSTLAAAVSLTRA